MDDHHALHFAASVRLKDVAAVFHDREYTGELQKPNTSDWYGRFRYVQDADNDYLIDRAKQRSGESFTGIHSKIAEVIAITESTGPIVDRTIERLGPADILIIRIRRRLLAAARALAEQGTAPPGVLEPESYRVRGGYISLPTGTDGFETTAALRAAPEQPMIDLLARPPATVA
jgi:hypothetical protein